MREIAIPYGRPTHDTVPATQAPVPHDRSFFDASYEHWQKLGSVPDVTVPVNEKYHPMSPIERSTGVVLPIISEARFGKTNRHHGHFFKSVYEAGDPGQKAVRLSRLQRVQASAHERYHQVFMGTELPKSPDEQYRLAVLNCAGYVPDKAIFIREQGQVSLVELSPKQRLELCKPNILTFEGNSQIQSSLAQFLLDYALSQNFDTEKQEEVNKFLDLTPEKLNKNESLRAQKLHLAKRLTNIAIAQAVRPINNEFYRAREQRALREDAPETAWHVVKRQVQRREVISYDTLEQNLLMQMAEAA